MFNLKKIEGGRINVFEPEMLTVGDNDLDIGTACTLSSGKLVAATGKPTHVTLAKGAKGARIPCGRVESNQVFETTFSAAPGALNVGDKVALGSGKTVTATKADDGATIVDLLDAKAIGDAVLVRF